MAEENVQKSLNEIVFEHRNKAYGAYHLRRIYRLALTKAFLIGASIFVLAILGPYSVMVFAKSIVVKAKDITLDDAIDVTIPDVPLVDEPPPPPPPKEEKPPEPPPKVKMIKDIVPEPKKEVVIESPPPTKEEQKTAAIGTETQDGTETDEQAPPPPPTDTAGNGPSDFNEVLLVVDQPSTYPGGLDKFRNKVSEIFEYPEDALDDGLEGTVVIKFIVERDGRMTGFKVIKSVAPSLDEEALRCLKELAETERWLPAKLNDQPVRSFYTFPFRFELGG